MIRFKSSVLISMVMMVFLISFTVSAMDFQEFYELCKTGTAEEINAVIQIGVDINKTVSGMTPLMVAAKENTNYGVITALVNGGAYLNKTDYDDWTALMHGVVADNYQAVEELIYLGANLNARNDNGNTALMLALLSKNGTLLSKLLYAGANINVQNKHGETVLMIAIQNGFRPNLIKSLVNAGSNVNIRNKKGITPLMLEMMTNYRNMEVVEILLKAGADVDIRDDNGWTALMYSVEKPDLKLIKKLIRAGAGVDIANSDGQSVLMVALNNQAELDEVTILIHNGAKVNQTDKKGMTPLIYAVNNLDDLMIIRYLVELGAELDAADNIGMTALSYGVKADKEKTVLELLDYGVDPNQADILGLTPLMIAGKYSNNSMIFQGLIEKGARVNEQNPVTGKTALMYTVENTKNADVINLLLDLGANPMIRDFVGKRVVDYLETNDDLWNTEIYWTLNYLEPDRIRKEILDMKSEGEAMLWAAVIPSAGHIYAENWWPKGFGFLAGEGVLLALALTNPEDGIIQVLPWALLGGLKIWEIYDAGYEVEKFNDEATDYNKKVRVFNKTIDR